MSIVPCAPSPPSVTDTDVLCVQLREQSYAVAGGLFDAALLQELYDECVQLHATALLRPADIGHGAARQHDAARRGDAIRWLDPATACGAQRAFLDAMEALRAVLNRTLMLGLDEVEAHLAVYPPGAGYMRHLDRFRDDDARVLSLVCYLNPAWESGDGGELRLHLPQGALDVSPRRGTSVLFLSDEVEHEVRPTGRLRASVAGWFRRRALSLRR